MPHSGQGKYDTHATGTGILIVIIIILIATMVILHDRRGHDGRDQHQEAELPYRESLESRDPACSSYSGDLGCSSRPERQSVHAAFSRLYSTADVDPLVTGQLYDHADRVRNVYGQRTSHGDVQGLTEFSSSGGPGDVGVDVGPYGLDEYGGKEVGFDDGIPEMWQFPSTPVRWYRPKQRDYFGPEGPTVYSEGMYALTEPDHDPLMP